MKKLSFKKYLKKEKKIMFYLSRKFYDYLEHYYKEYIDYCKCNNYEYEDLESDYNEAIALNDIDMTTESVIKKEIPPAVNELGERWSGAVNYMTGKPLYGLDVPDWLDSEYKSFCENINDDLIEKGLVFMRVSGENIAKVVSYKDCIFTLEDGTTIDLIKEGINEMEVGCYPPSICSYDENNNFQCKAIYGISIEIGRFGYNEILVFVAKEEYLQDILKLC